MSLQNLDEEEAWIRGLIEQRRDEKARVEKISGLFAEIMRTLELDLEDPHLHETPDRFARMYLEVFQGLEDQNEPAITCFSNAEGYTNMVLLRNIEFFSMCSHHMIPFFGEANIAYIPGEKVVELSTVARMVDFFARRPQLQERLTKQIVDFLQKKLEPQGVIAVIEARHLCMEMRGVEKPGTLTTTSAFRGCFEDQRTREEFLFLLST